MARFETLEGRLLLADVPSGFSDQTVVGNLDSPTAMVVAPDGRIFVAEQTGTIRVVKNGTLLSKPFFTVSDINSASERGLLGIELDPNFENNGFVYIYYTSSQGGNLHNRLARLTANGDVAQSGSLDDLVDFPSIGDAVFHMGGALHFGPDGKIYVALGDHEYFDGTKLQTLEIPFGKILRFNSNGTIPSDNPFYTKASGVNRATYVMGLRNPFTFNFQPGTGRMFINDVGQEQWEEIDEGKAGRNFGWPVSEGPDNVGSFTGPIYYYSHNEGVAITGSVFYNPGTSQFPSQFVGRYFFGDVGAGFIRMLDPGNGNSVSGFATGLTAPVDLDLGTDGSLLYLQRGSDTNQGSIGRISYGSPTGARPGIVTQPSDAKAGLGQAVQFSVVASGSGLSYRWQHDGQFISGASHSALTINPVTLADAGTYRVRVSNSAGSVFSGEASLNVINNTAPTAKFVSPTSGTTFRAGQTITFDARANDAEDGKLGPSKFRWQVDYITGTVVRPLMSTVRGIRSGKFTIPTSSPYTKTDVKIRIKLTVRDSAGSNVTYTRNLKPQTSTFTLASNVSGVQLTLDEQPKTAGQSFKGVVGQTRVIGAPENPTVQGKAYVFDHWSDGGAVEHDISTPLKKKTFTAMYRAASATAQGRFSSAPPISALPPKRDDSPRSIDDLVDFGVLV